MFTFVPMTFELALTDEKVKPHQVTALHLLSALSFIGAAAILYWLYLPVKIYEAALLFSGIVLLLVTIIKNKWLLQAGPNRAARIFELMVLLCLCSYVYLHHWWIATGMFAVLSAAVLFAIYWERAGNSEHAIRIDQSGIRLPITSRKRFIEWPDVEKVLLRFGTLTVDCTDKRWFQWNIDYMGINENEFETFCNNQVELNKRKRRNDDW